jgi:type IV pilus assembly protein PilW
MKQHNLRRAQGFSLTELMVALTIGLVIMAAVSTVFVNTSKAYNTQERLARTQDNGRFAMYYLIRDLRMGGHNGCVRNFDPSTNFTSHLKETTGFFFGTAYFTTPIEAIEDVTASASPAWYPSTDTTAVPDNTTYKAWRATVGKEDPTKAKPDMLAVRMIDTATTAKVTDNPMASPSADPSVDKPALFKKNDIVFLSDCVRADLFQISADPTSPALPHDTSGNSPGNATTELGKQYDASARVYRYATRRYYIGLNANNVPSLFRDENNLGPVELVEGIESLQVLFGVTNAPPDGPPARYLKANAMTAIDWANIVSVKIGILARTANTRDTNVDQNTYDVNGTTLGPFNDANSRRVFVATVSLKNRILP